MKSPPRILVVDDNAMNVDILRARLVANGYDVITSSDGEDALNVTAQQKPDLILLDVMMPKLDGIEVCRRIKTDQSLPFIPIILVTARSEPSDVVEALDAGGDEYLTKPVDPSALIARVRSMLRIKEQQDTISAQRAELEEWNQKLQERVEHQVEHIERLGRLRRFLSPALADLVVSSCDDAFLRPHRRQIACVFADLRGSAAFIERVEPEEVTEVLDAYHVALGHLIQAHGATVDHFAGDGVLVFLNDPLPCPNAAAQALRMAAAMRARMADLQAEWRRRGYELGFGVGASLGYATIGQVGFEGRREYSANGGVVILAARLCGEAADGQILVTQPVLAAAENLVEAQPVGELKLKGFARPVSAFNVVKLRDEQITADV